MPLYNATVMVRLILDSKGRILIPTSMLHGLQLAPGDTLEAELSGDQITLRQVRRKRDEEDLEVDLSGLDSSLPRK